MNVLLVAPMPPSPTAALAIPRVLHAQLVGLGEKGHRVTLAVVAGPEEHELDAVERLRADGVDLHAVCRHEPRTSSERWRRRRRLGGGWLRGDKPWRSVWYFEPGLQPVLDELLAERSFDVIAVEDNAAAVYRLGGTAPVVFTEHEVRRPRRFQLTARPKAVLSEVDWRRWPGYHRSTWNRFDLVQTFTQRDANGVLQIAPELAGRVRVNPFGLELPDPLPPAGSSSRELVFVGNYTHPPNVDAAFWLASEIMPGLRSREAGARLTLVGPWAPEAVRDLACEDIVVAGSVPAVRPYIEAAAVVLAPLRIGGGMRMKVLEALALGRSVVTTPRGAEGLESAPDGTFVAVDSTDSYVDAVARLLTDPQTRDAMAERGRTYATEHHSPTAYAERLERVYEEAQALRSNLSPR
jgi:glycosyltransferase involved in cell wall biosynthesis